MESGKSSLQRESQVSNKRAMSLALIVLLKTNRKERDEEE